MYGSNSWVRAGALILLVIAGGCGGEGTPPAQVTARCDDGIGNGDETDVDCGGSCPACATGSACTGGADCASLVCAAGRCAAAACDDTRKNGDETDVDC